jgi:hypothetical protein
MTDQNSGWADDWQCGGLCACDAGHVDGRSMPAPALSRLPSHFVDAWNLAFKYCAVHDVGLLSVQGEGPISKLRWSGHVIAWANDKGVKIYDTQVPFLSIVASSFTQISIFFIMSCLFYLSTTRLSFCRCKLDRVSESAVYTPTTQVHQRIGFIERQRTAFRADACHCHLQWESDVLVYIGWGNSVQIARIVQQEPNADSKANGRAPTHSVLLAWRSRYPDLFLF